ncbi:MAG: flagellar biosynthetic protein FliO [Clostridiaceae bacterium]|nr:flagellar biosynthetic protein FliO [Clostridiaceae bacterium]
MADSAALDVATTKVNYFESLFYIIIMIAVIVLAYFVSRFLSVRVAQMSRGRYIEVIDRVALGKDKSLFIAKVGEKMFLVCETNDSSTTICELTKDDLIPLEKLQKPSFNDIFKNYLKNAQSVDKNTNAFNLDTIKEKLNSSREKLSKIKGKEKDNDKI